MNTSLTQALGEYSQDESTHYLLGLDVIGQETSTGWSYNGYDGLGSVRGMFDGMGTAVQSRS